MENKTSSPKRERLREQMWEKYPKSLGKPNGKTSQEFGKYYENYILLLKATHLSSKIPCFMGVQEKTKQNISPPAAMIYD